MVKHYNIPLFFPETACPFRCVYCNQQEISGQVGAPEDREILHTINRHLSSFPNNEREVEIAFFGGSFTGLPAEHQKHYLALVSGFVASGAVNGIRLSTRPDFISPDVLDLLCAFPVKTIELGAQSLDDEVLRKSGRGHTSSQVARASALILERRLRLGLQMMTGLPGDTPKKSLATAQKIIELGAHETRIYPCVVIRNTVLERLNHKGIYHPQSLDDAVDLTSRLYLKFREAGVKVLRIGLHPSEDLNGSAFVAGPYHPSFNELVMSRIWHDLFLEEFASRSGNLLELRVPPHQLNHAVGYGASNKKMLLHQFKRVRFRANSAQYDFTFSYSIVP